MLKLLRDNGANVDIKDGVGRTPLSLAQDLEKQEKSEKIVALIEETIAKCRRLTP